MPGSTPSPHTRWTVAALATAVALRLAFSLLYWVDKPLTHDEQEYLLLARNLRAGAGFTYETGGDAGPTDGAGGADDVLPPERFGRVPAYPLFVAAVVPAGTLAQPPASVPASLKIAQAFVGALGVWLLGRLARRAAGDRAALAAMWIAALYPPLVWFCAYALSETMYTALVFAAVVTLSRVTDVPRDASAGRAAERGAVRRVAAAGALAGLATLTRPATLFFLPLVLLFFIARRQVLLAAVLGLSAVAVVVPWTIRNALAYGRIVPVSSQGGITFWTGNNRLATGEGDMAANPEIKLANLELRRRHPSRSPEALEPIYWREAFRDIAADPLWWLGLQARKAFYTVVPIGPSYRLHSPRYFVASLVSYGALLPFGVLGALALQRRAEQPRALWMLAGSAVLVCLVFFPQERFRVPVLDPALIVCAGAWAARKRGAASLASS
jgi:4-amino-4-deoxy-L-arabinose transferase-like glycosyltransferase